MEIIFKCIPKQIEIVRSGSAYRALVLSVLTENRLRIIILFYENLLECGGKMISFIRFPDRKPSTIAK